jgi:hypothetical protein
VTLPGETQRSRLFLLFHVKQFLCRGTGTAADQPEEHRMARAEHALVRVFGAVFRSPSAAGFRTSSWPAVTGLK